jgi:hypothetical protein
MLLENLTTGTTIAAADLAIEYEILTNRARFAYTGSPNGVLPDGNYRATIAAGAVEDLYGNTNQFASIVNFFVLGGDANQDRTVDIGDFAIVAANFNNFATYSLGDFDYDGLTTIGDFAVLAANFNTSLPAARASADGGNEVRLLSAPAAGIFSDARIDRTIDRLDELVGGTA